MKRGPNPIRTERRIDITNAHAYLRVLPHGADEATIVEARLRRAGEERYRRARHLEVTAPLARLHLPPEAVSAIEAKRAKLAKQAVRS